MIELLTLGSLDLHMQNGPQAASVLAQPRRTALLCYLALARPHGFHRRDALAALFWPEQDAEHARTALRQALYVLRRSLGEEAVVSRGDEELGVSPDVVWCDALAFEAAVHDGRAAQAVELYRGDLLPGFFIEGAPEFERWLSAERDYLRGRAAQAAWVVAEQQERGGNAVGAAEWGRRALELSPADETVLRRLLLLLERSGDRAAALRAYEAFTRQLRAEFDLEPSAETRALAEAIRSGGSSGAREVEAPRAAGVAAGAGERARTAGEAPRAGAEGLAAALRRGLRRPTGRAVLTLLAVCGLAGGAFLARGPLGIRAPHSLVAMGALDPQDRVLIADFATAGADTALAQLVTEAFRADFQRTRSVRVVTSDRVRDGLRRMLRDPATPLDPALARELAQRDGVAAVLDGTVGRAGTAYLLTVRLVASPDGRVLAAFRETARDSTRLLDAIDRLSAEVRDRVGEPLRTVRAEPPLEQVTTSSLPALLSYSQAVRAERAGDAERERVLLEEAVSLDTAFAAAHSRLGILLITQDERQRGVEALTRAYRHRDRLSEAERYLTVGLYHEQVTGDRSEAISALRSTLELEPENARALWHLGHLYALELDGAHAEQIYERYLRLRPDDRFGHRALIEAQVSQGRLEVAAASAQRMARQVPDSLGAAEVMALLASVRGDYAPLERHARGIIARTDLPIRDDRAAAHRILADVLLCQGRLAEANREMEFQAEAAARLDHLGIALRNAARPGLVIFLFYGDTAAARRRADQALKRYPMARIPPADRPYAVFAGGYAQVGYLDRAHAFLAQARAQTMLEAGWAEGYAAAYALGWIALAEGRTADAIREFRRMNLTGSGCPGCEDADVGYAFERSGQPDSAIAAYERYVARPHLERYAFDALALGRMLERLALLEEARGDRDRAARANARLIVLWRSADPGLQPRVAAARARLARLDRQGRVHVRLPLEP